MRYLRSTVLVLMALSAAAAGQTPQLVKDLNTTARKMTEGSGPSSYFAHTFKGGARKVYFWASNGSAIRPFVHDLATGQTVELSSFSIFPGTAGFTSLGDRVYFLAFYQGKVSLVSVDASNGTKVHATVGAFTPQLVRAGNLLFFAAEDSSAGVELHVWDGTSVRLVKDIVAGGNSGSPQQLTASGSVVFFTAYDDSHGRELWKSDGTADGTQMVKDIETGATSSNPTRLTAGFDPVAGTHTLLFAATTSGQGFEPWVSDGVPLGSGTKVLDIHTGGSSNAGDFYYDSANKQFFFSADDGKSGQELWRTDGTLAGTKLVKDIAKGAAGSFPGLIGSDGSKLFFVANDGVHGQELWTSSSSGTAMVRDINPGTGQGATIGTMSATSKGVRCFFSGRSVGSLLREVWTSDGTSSGTVLVKAFRPTLNWFYLKHFTATSNGILFTASDEIYGEEPWFSDGTPAGTTLLDDVNKTQVENVTDHANPRAGIGRLDAVWFAGFNGTSDRIWQSTGTEQGTTEVMGGGREIREVTQLESGGVFWTALLSSNSRLLFHNGASLGGGTNAANLTAVGDRLFFTAEDTTHGNELWTSLGTRASTHMVLDIKPGSGSSSPHDIIAFGGNAYFVAASGLWRSDGAEAGTVKLASSVRGPLVAAGPYVYFQLDDRSQNGLGRELWRTDGTVAGTKLVKDINGALESGPRPLAALGDTLLFLASDATHGRELWKTDGTAAGTVLVKDLRPGVTNTNIVNATTVGDRVYFAGRTVKGSEPWVSDGTTAGTYMLRDIAVVGQNSSDPGPFVASRKGFVWFPATSEAKGRELWRTDGTPAGTTLVYDLIGGPLSSDPEILGIIESDKPRLLFAATDWVKGRELFAIDLPGATRTLGQGCAYQAQPPSLYVEPSLSPLFTIAEFGGRYVRPNSVVFLLVSAKPAAPLSFLGCTLWVDPSFVLMGPYSATNGAWKGSLYVNFSKSDYGMQIAWQAAVFPSPGPLGMDLSNGVITTFGL